MLHENLIPLLAVSYLAILAKFSRLCWCLVLPFIPAKNSNLQQLWNLQNFAVTKLWHHAPKFIYQHGKLVATEGPYPVSLFRNASFIRTPKWFPQKIGQLFNAFVWLKVVKLWPTRYQISKSTNIQRAVQNSRPACSDFLMRKSYLLCLRSFDCWGEYFAKSISNILLLIMFAWRFWYCIVFICTWYYYTKCKLMSQQQLNCRCQLLKPAFTRSKGKEALKKQGLDQTKMGR